ncbi:MAG: hypothetical protein AB7F89_12940, partial [Pirellulaceae bacterium]
MIRPNSTWSVAAPLVAHLFARLLAVNCVGADEKLHAIMLSDVQVTRSELQAAKGGGTNAIVLQLEGRSGEERQREVSAAQRIQESGLDLYYWIEIARCPELADAHPEWMASLQGHSEWRRFFQDVPRPKPNVEVVKNYPWVPVLYEETFEAHRQRVQQLLRGMPAAKGIFLNDLQGAPSACGCGNPLCRWTGDYGPIKTATPLPADAAARFVEAVSKLAAESEIIPVWTTECEEHDGMQDGLCAGVGCFQGICWKAYTRQLAPLAEGSKQLGVLLPFRAFERDLPLYGDKAGWIRHALASFQSMPPRHGGKSIAAQRLVCVLQGWDVTASEL